jgi:hypothetical protein
MLSAAERSLNSVSVQGYRIVSSGPGELWSPALSAATPTILTGMVSKVRAGRYTEVVACVGTGSIKAILSIGDITAAHRANCRQSPHTFELHVVALKPADVTIQLAGQDRGTVAVSYYLDSNHANYAQLTSGRGDDTIAAG